MANRVWQKLLGTLTPGLAVLTGVVKLGASGAIASQVCNGFSVAHAGSGLYTFTLEDTYNRLDSISIVEATASPITLGAGYYLVKASNTIDSSPPGKTFTVQTYNPSSLANALPQDNAEFRIVIFLKNSGRSA